MRIIILGAGQVGSSIAQILVAENNDITVVDIDRQRLEYLQTRLDLRTLAGDAVLPSILQEAGLADADMLIAVTRSDQTNLIACKLAHTLFNVPMRIARLRSAEFSENPVLLSEANFAVSYTLRPEQVVTDYLVKLVEFPEALQVLYFANDRVALVAVKAYPGGLMVGRPIREMRDHLGDNVDARISAVFRHDHAVKPTGDTVIEAGDEVFILAADEHIRRVMIEMRRMTTPVKRVIIAGGGNIGLRVAQMLDGKCMVKVMERDSARAQTIASQIGDGLVLLGDATDEELLQQESINETDLFLALTNDDEDNIMAASLAKSMGCTRVLALINRRAYADLVMGGPIDIALSPALVSIGDLLTHVRRGFVAKVHSLRRGAAEAIELIVHGDEKNSRVVGRRVGDLPVIQGATLVAIVRDFDKLEDIAYEGMVKIKKKGHVVIAHKDEVIKTADHVIVFCLSTKVIKKVEQLFQVAASFL